MRYLKPLLLIMGIFGLCQALIAAETATVSVDTKLYSSNSMQASVVAQLKQGAEVTIDQRKGGWYQISQASGKGGWVRSYDVQIASNASWFTRLKNVIAGGYSTQTNSSATIGIRGLGPGDVKKAAPNLGELAKLENHKASLTDGKMYAASVPLKANRVNYFTPLKKTASSSKPKSSGSSATSNAATGSLQDNNTQNTNNNKKGSETLDDIGEGLKDVGGAIKGLFGD